MIWHLIGRGLRLLWRAIKIFVGLVILLFILNYSTLPLGDEWTHAAVIARNDQFDYVGWEINALATKAEQTLYGDQPFMSEADRSAYVRAYIGDLGKVQSIERKINAIYADPKVADPAAASADLRAQRDHLRADLSQRQPLAESILEGQVAAVLVDQGFGLDGQLLPPIAMHFTQVPDLLIISPRDKIRFDVSINLYPMPVDQMDALENKIDKQLNVSSLIVPLGGIALYPAMILETSSLPFAVQTFAHEWLHHYLFFYPLGLNYTFGGETRIINESTAEQFGQAIAPLVLRRYYPDLAPPPSDHRSPPPSSSKPPPTPDPNAFDFGAAMNETRVTVDHLLADGKIDQAEAYMEQRRELFVAHGYLIRKLNQAYFAFYGGYQTAAPGQGGSNPIGPAVAAIKQQSASIYDWIATMRGIATRDQLLAAVKK